jgi:hypothetical protein
MLVSVSFAMLLFADSKEVLNMSCFKQQYFNSARCAYTHQIRSFENFAILLDEVFVRTVTLQNALPVLKVVRTSDMFAKIPVCALVLFHCRK